MLFSPKLFFPKLFFLRISFKTVSPPPHILLHALFVSHPSSYAPFFFLQSSFPHFSSHVLHPRFIFQHISSQSLFTHTLLPVFKSGFSTFASLLIRATKDSFPWTVGLPLLGPLIWKKWSVLSSYMAKIDGLLPVSDI